jgi:hypothetical protein
LPNDAPRKRSNRIGVKVNAKKTKAVLPIGRTARLACQLDTMREECCKAAAILAAQTPLNESELEECARLDDALAQAQFLLKSTVARVIYSRLKRRSRAENSES